MTYSLSGRWAADELIRRDRVVVVKLITGPPDEDEWMTGYDAVSKTTEKQKFNAHGTTGTVIIYPYHSLAAFGVKIEYEAARRGRMDDWL